MTLLPQSKERYLRSPVLRARDARTALLFAVEWAGDTEQIVERVVDDRAQLVAGPRVVATHAGGVAVLDLRGAEPAASNDVSLFDEASDMASGARVEIERAHGRSRVVLHRGGARTTVWDAFGTAAAPELASWRGGHYVAFHHNVREDNGQPDISKWIEIRYVDANGVVSELASPMLERDRDKQGEEQGFEFPTLVVGDDGALRVYGRGSHCYYAQDVTANGWAARVALAVGTWGCRGRRVACVRLGDAVVTARREREGVLVETSAAPRGGAPALRRLADVEIRGERARVKHTAALALPDGTRNLFGDIHQHSAHSDGCGTADEPYLRARWIYGDDFGALSDHESFLGKRIGPGEWSYLQHVADRHNEPESFATIFAYEWTGRSYPGPGHKVVYMPTLGSAVVSRDDVPEGVDVLREVKTQGGFAVPHHVGWTGSNDEAHDPTSQPVWEICSCHGCYESFGHPLGQRGDLRDHMVDAVLKRGHRFGFIACSDGHGLLWHHGVGRKRDPFRTGLTVVQSRSRTREAILDAIRRRQCYATSGTRIELDVRVDGSFPMGSILRTRDVVQVRAVARGSSEILSLSLVGPDGVVASSAGKGIEALIEARVQLPYVYARVEQVDREMAWSSPVFTDASS